MIQDIAPSHLSNHYDPAKTADENSIILVFSGEKNLLGHLDSSDEDFFLMLTDSENKEFLNSSAKAPYDFYNLRDFRSIYYYPQTYVYASFTAYQLAEWYIVTKFCGKCGAENEHSKTERAKICPKCGNIIYPRINPAVIIGVIDKESNKLLVTRYRTGFSHNALVAGFTEIGETLEETVSREVMEEEGIHVTKIS